ncbi:hypothetical protein HD806DRAFT_224994 [Xylariaceae sp. AK1471]|nr:hypothetical protein HD806DRAFT_224994 [Xylariaceae sp. AK1471]
MAERNTDASENTFDSALIDPRLLQLDAASEASRSSTQAPASTHSPAPALSPAPLQLPASVPALPQDQFQNANGDPMQGHDSELPSTVYMSLDRLLTTRNVTANEHLWYMGIQYGIGLGIMSTREAILNEMQHHHTVFNRTFQLDEHDFNYFHMRMTIGQACTVGFDLRVAQRAANAVIDQQRLIAQTVVTDGLTSALPGIGDPVIGTSTFFSEEDVARCHDNSRLLDETFLQGNAQELPGLEMGGGSDIGAERFTASFLAGGPNIGGIDMTRLDGTAGLVANAITMSTNGNTGIANAIPMSTNDRTGIANALPMSTNGSPGLPIGHDLGKGFPPIAASMLHLNQLSPFGGGVAPTMLHLNRPPFWGGAIPPAGTSMPHHRRIHQSASHSRNNARGGDEVRHV